MDWICPVTNKRAYKDKLDADIAISQVQLKHKKHRTNTQLVDEPVRSYLCNHCAYWHMTSQEKRQPA